MNMDRIQPLNISAFIIPLSPHGLQACKGSGAVVVETSWVAGEREYPNISLQNGRTKSRGKEPLLETCGVENLLFGVLLTSDCVFLVLGF